MHETIEVSDHFVDVGDTVHASYVVDFGCFCGCAEDASSTCSC